MDVRIAAHEDYDRIKSMWSCCFDDKASFVDWYFENIYLPENTLCVWEKDTMVSSLQILPRRIFVRGAFQPAGYVVGVMTLPQYRGRGYAGHLLQSAAELMNQRGLFLSVLVSDVDPRFYRKFGWELTHNITEITMDAGSAPALPLRPAQTAEIPLLQSYYERYCSNGLHGYFFRDSGIWRNLLADLEMDGGQACLIMNKDTDSPCGYMLLLSDDEKEDNTPLKVKEFVFFDSRNDSYHGAADLLGAPALQSGLTSALPPELPLSAPLPMALPIKTRTKPFLMSRVINLRGLLENCHVPQTTHDYEGAPLSFEVALTAPELMDASANTWAALILGAADNELYKATMNRLENPLRNQIACLFPAANNYACELF